MFLGTGGSEGARDGEENDFLAGGKGGDCGGLEFSIGVEVGEGSVRKLVSDGDCGGDLGCFGGK